MKWITKSTDRGDGEARHVLQESFLWAGNVLAASMRNYFHLPNFWYYAVPPAYERRCSTEREARLSVMQELARRRLARHAVRSVR